MHFINPVPVLVLVKSRLSLLTFKAVEDQARTFVAERLDKNPIVAPDCAGFTDNALSLPDILSGSLMFEQSLGSAEDVDEGMVGAWAHPEGPLALADLNGLDAVMRVAEILDNDHREHLSAPPPLLKRMAATNFRGHNHYSYG